MELCVNISLINVRPPQCLHSFPFSGIIFKEKFCLVDQRFCDLDVHVGRSECSFVGCSWVVAKPKQSWRSAACHFLCTKYGLFGH